MEIFLARKRLIASIIIKNGIVVQSFGFSKYLPLGKPEIFVENLDRWGADEIMISVIDRSINKLGPDYDLIKRIRKVKPSTPIIYSGGIRTSDEANKVIQHGAERVAVDAMLFDTLDEIKKISKYIGSQALIIALPVTFQNNQLLHFNYIDRRSSKFSSGLIDLIKCRIVSEVLLIDWFNEGKLNKFNNDIIGSFFDKSIPLILFGGINNSKQIDNLLLNKNVSAISIGNVLSYSETAIQKIKSQLDLNLVRPPYYEKKVV